MRGVEREREKLSKKRVRTKMINRERQRKKVRKIKMRKNMFSKRHLDFSSSILYFTNSEHRQTEELCLLDRHHMLWVPIIHYLHKQQLDLHMYFALWREKLTFRDSFK